MNRLIHLKTAPPIFVAIIALAYFGLLPKVQAVVPPPDGCYPNITTAEGCDALHSLTTGAGNTALGWHSLFVNSTGGFNTGVGSGVLALNNGDSNTAVGAAALLLNATGSENTALGTAALVNNDGDDNTAVGAFALNNNTAGDGNTAVGSGALFSNATGFANTATGFQALNSNTTGIANTANGIVSLYHNTEGNQNTSTGFNALFHNTTGDDNTANGVNALFSNTVGQNNSAYGYRALQSNTIGYENTACGTEALSSNTEGFDNTAVGQAALMSHQDGTANTAIGAYALQAHTLGPYNTAVGTFALRNNATGGENTALGVSAGSNITGNGNVCIGEDVRGEGSVDDRTYIRNINTDTVSGGGTGNVTVDFTTGRVGHAVSSRRYKEEIQAMDNASETLYRLKPVTYRYKKEVDRTQNLEYGLVAEDVAEVAPDLAIRNAKGQIESVRYRSVNTMLLNEFIKEHKAFVEAQRKVGKLESTVASLAAKVKEQATQIERVRDELQFSRSAPALVRNE